MKIIFVKGRKDSKKNLRKKNEKEKKKFSSDTNRQTSKHKNAEKMGILFSVYLLQTLMYT